MITRKEELNKKFNSIVEKVIEKCGCCAEWRLAL
jgi:hypothetical protein